MTEKETEHNPHHKDVTPISDLIDKVVPKEEPAPPPEPPEPEATPAPEPEPTPPADPEKQKKLGAFLKKDPTPPTEPEEKEEPEYQLTSKDKRDIEAFATQRTRIAELERKLAEKPVSGDADELDRLKAENEEQAKIIRTIDLSQDKHFKQKYDGPVEQQLLKAKRLIPDEGQLKSFAETLSLPPAEWATALEEKFGTLAPALLNISLEIDVLREAKQKALADAQQESARISQQATTVLERDLKQAIANAREEMIIFQPMEGEPDWNKDYLAVFEENVQNSSLPIHTLRTRAAAAPALEKMVFDLLNRIEELNGQMSNFINLDPDLTDSRTTIDKKSDRLDPSKVHELSAITDKVISGLPGK